MPARSSILRNEARHEAAKAPEGSSRAWPTNPGFCLGSLGLAPDNHWRVVAVPNKKRPGALRELSPQQSTGPNQPRGWLSKQCARKRAEYQQPVETVNRSLLGVPTKRPRRCLIRVEWVRRGLTLRCEDPRAVRLLPQQVRRLPCSASGLKRNCDQHYKSKSQERHQASHHQSGTIPSNEFRHFSPPVVSGKTKEKHKQFPAARRRAVALSGRIDAGPCQAHGLQTHALAEGTTGRAAERSVHLCVVRRLAPQNIEIQFAERRTDVLPMAAPTALRFQISKL